MSYSEGKLDVPHAALVIVVLAYTFFFVYSPHLEYDFPFHVDEWRHITEARRVIDGSYHPALEVGFHIFLALLYKTTDLVLIYRFLPAVFACISSIVLFYTTLKLSKNYSISVLSMVFFTSIKSNVNITGMWFFTPLTFSIPLIYLFAWLYSEAVSKDDVRKLLLSFLVYLTIAFFHIISATFLIPAIILYSLLNRKFFIKHWKTSAIALLIPIATYIAFTSVLNVDIPKDPNQTQLIFKHGWGIYEIDLPIIHGYSHIAALLAVLGIPIAYKKRQHLHLLWMLTTLTAVYAFPHLGYSVFAPYQRNYYYFLLSLPLLSAYGTNTLYGFIKSRIKNENKTLIVFSIMMILALTFTFKDYWSLPGDVKIYQLIDENDYQALKFLESIDQSDSKVMADSRKSMAVYPVSGHEIVGGFFFWGNKDDTERFFKENCTIKQDLIKKHAVRYILSKEPLDCEWETIYNKENFIYNIQ